MAARCVHHCPAKPHLHPDRGRQTYPQPNQTKQEAKANQNQTVSHNYHNFIAVSSGGFNFTPSKAHPFCILFVINIITPTGANVSSVLWKCYRNFIASTSFLLK